MGNSPFVTFTFDGMSEEQAKARIRFLNGCLKCYEVLIELGEVNETKH